MLSSSRSLAVGGTGGGSVDLLDALLEQYPAPTEFARRLLNLRGVKIFGDGIPPTHTAWVYEPYVDSGGVGGLAVAGGTDDERVRQLTAIVRRAHLAGFQVGTHATGDRTIDVVTDAYLAAIRADRSFRDPRHYTIHSDLVTDAALGRLARHGLGTSMNPSIKAAIADAMIGVLGPERARRQWPLRSALDSGVTLTSASDWPVTPPDWRAGVIAAVLRKDLVSGNVSGPEQRVGVLEAVRTYTTAGAHQDGAESWKGRLVPGMAADVCVLDGVLPTTADEVEALAGIPVALTVFNGTIEYERPAAASSSSTSSTGTVTAGTGAAGTAALAGARASSAACTHGEVCCCTRAPDLLAGRA
jgi:predicted amidohydrolase YtcJ